MAVSAVISAVPGALCLLLGNNFKSWTNCVDEDLVRRYLLPPSISVQGGHLAD